MAKNKDTDRDVREAAETDAPADESVEQTEELEQHEPPFTTLGFLTSPKFGAAGSGGLEYEQLPEAHDHDKPK
jgi:hypothetical protein